MNRLKIHWVTKSKEAVGNALGYQSHNTSMLRHCEKIMDLDDNSNIALSIVPADHFQPVPGKFNILFTMWECLDLPQSYIDAFKKADLIIVPSKFCETIFRPYTDKPIKVCWEGVEPSKYKYMEREFPFNVMRDGKLVQKNGQRFRFLWLGAPNPRKGYMTIMRLVELVEKVPQWELYIKTTASKKSTLKEFLKINTARIKAIVFDKKEGEIKNLKMSIKRFFKPGIADRIQIMGKFGNIFFDTRKLPLDELLNLYKLAHCYLSPHCGEGWGLPLSEAMATGLPCIATDATGVKDFFDSETGYPAKYEIKRQELVNYDLNARIFIPDTQDFADKMIYIFQNYGEALRKGRKASDKILNKFTWENSAKRLDAIIKEALN